VSLCRARRWGPGLTWVGRRMTPAVGEAFLLPDCRSLNRSSLSAGVSFRPWFVGGGGRCACGPPATGPVACSAVASHRGIVHIG
jgi:hypothetical protein